ncbi:hypothetical protein PRUPE_1G178500 [Prunus persica]|uniref:IBH1-like N-terminal domain-containing protein n=2 Tax=Prunus persica TaxID=3760 RepID=M5Y5I2_PRUPE|nr:hypothetical protein PRUPE_1G178500 [Prunus persica]
MKKTLKLYLLTMTNITTTGVTLNIKSCRTKFAHRFVRSLLQIRNHAPPSSSSSSEEKLIQKRRQRIKIAAYLSMAHAVGPRMNWSRALLFKLRNRACRHRKKKRIVVIRRKTKKASRSSQGSVPVDQAKKLRRLVPGAKSMDLCSLLEETAHYITCLSTQIKVMQALADHLSK